jgi:hypothetical protein
MVTRAIVTRLLLVVLAGSLPLAIAARAVVWQPVPTSALPTWMAGCWSGERGEERFHERWFVGDASTLLALAHTTKTGTMTGFEFLRVVVRNGHPVYIAQPGGAPPTEFAATSSGASRIVFENPKHDFPKRIVYVRVGDDRLTASIDGGGAGDKRVEFAMAREACGS